MSDEVQNSDEFQAMVREFHIGIGQKKDVDLRINLIEEEAKEFIDAVDAKSVVATIDALCDLLYVTYGSADVFDIMLDASKDAALLPVTLTDVNWAKIRQDLRAFSISVEDAVKSLRLFQQFNAKGKLQNRLDDLVRGCWVCASQAIGVDLRPFFKEVHRTNMNKLKGPKREDGKQLKPEGWKPPRIAAMYNRLRAGNASSCCSWSCKPSVVRPDGVRAWLDHFEGGQYCGYCGGLNVES